MQRRSFVKSLAITTAGLTLSSQLFADSKKSPLGVQLYTLRDALSKDLIGTLDKLSSLGYNELELFGYNGTFFGKSPKDFCKICDDRGMRIISSHYVSGRTTNIAATLSNGWQKAVDDAAETKAKYMVCAWLPPNERTAELYKSLPDLLNKSAEICSKSNIQLCYHNHDFEFQPLDGVIPLEMILQNSDKDKVKMELDLYWITKAGQDPVAYFEKYPGRFPLWHVKDLEKGTGVFTEVGNGTIDFDRIFAASSVAGMQHWFVEQDVCKGDPMQSLAISRDYVVRKRY